MAKPVYIYWEGSFHDGAYQTAGDQESDAYDSPSRVKVDYRNLLQLAITNRPVKRAVFSGTVPPILRWLWKKLEEQGTKVDTSVYGFDADCPQLQIFMLHDCLETLETPGTAVFVTEGGEETNLKGVDSFKLVLERMHSVGWSVELLSWEQTCDTQMKKWVATNGHFINLENHYKSITYLEPEMMAPPRPVAPLDLTGRPGAGIIHIKQEGQQ